MSNLDDIKAINDYVLNRSAPAAGAPPAVVSKWQLLVSQWKGWYPKVVSSWYVSDQDLSNAKAIRNELMKNQNPDAWQYVKETAVDIAANKAKTYADKPDAPKPTTTPWKAEGLTYSGKYKTVAEVKALQQKINAAGYKPPLKIDGDYGKLTQAGEKWLSLQQTKTEAEKAADTAAAAIANKPVPKPAVEASVNVAPEAQKEIAKKLLGLRLDGVAAVGTGAGAIGGFAAAGPVGALVGTVIGFLAGQAYPRE